MEVDAFVNKKGFEFWPESRSHKACVQRAKCTENARAGTTLHCLNEHTVAVVVIQHENVIVARAGGDNKLYRLICSNLAGGGFDDSGKQSKDGYMDCQIHLAGSCRHQPWGFWPEPEALWSWTWVWWAVDSCTFG